MILSMKKIKFNIYLGNHDNVGKYTLLDFCEWIYCSLKELKLEVKISRSLYQNRLNIIFDNFTSDFYKFINEKKIPYGIICTETPSYKSFNNTDSFTMKYRKKYFDKMEKNAIFVWTTWGKSNFFNYNKNKYGYMKLGYSKLLDKRRDRFKSNEKKFDFFFSGSKNLFRDKVLKKISDNFDLKSNFFISSTSKYLNNLSKSKFFLCLQQNENWPCMPTTKIMSALHASSIPIILNPSNDTSELSNYYCSVKIEKLIDEINIIYKDYNKLQNIFEKYKTTCIAKDIMSKLICNLRFDFKESQDLDNKYYFNQGQNPRKHFFFQKIFITYYWKKILKKYFRYLFIKA